MITFVPAKIVKVRFFVEDSIKFRKFAAEKKCGMMNDEYGISLTS